MLNVKEPGKGEITRIARDNIRYTLAADARCVLSPRKDLNGIYAEKQMGERSAG